jgi:hypothetical protein
VNNSFSSLHPFRATACVALGVSLLFGLVACNKREFALVKLQAQTPPGRDLRRYEIRAQVASAQPHLRFKWIAEFGECDPQDSEWPSTIFRFAEGTTRDRITIEVWQEKTRLASDSIDLTVPDQRVNLPAKPALSLGIEITSVPPNEPQGGPNTRADIAGKVTGEVTSDLRIVLYARASEAWYIQPTPYISHPIMADGTWSTWTHTGSDYAALVVRTGFTPAVIYDVLPQVGGDVITRTIVAGRAK